MNWALLSRSGVGSALVWSVRNTVCITLSLASTVSMALLAAGKSAVYICCFRAGRHITSLSGTETEAVRVDHRS